jgi:RHS repeat-associated protein
VRGLVKRDANGTWQSSRRYRVYGAVLDSAGTDSITVRYRWIGREFDPETGFYFIRARSYDPESQRFLQEDPSGGENLYAYGDGNPVSARGMRRPPRAQLNRGLC